MDLDASRTHNTHTLYKAVLLDRQSTEPPFGPVTHDMAAQPHRARQQHQHHTEKLTQKSLRCNTARPKPTGYRIGSLPTDPRMVRCACAL